MPGPKEPLRILCFGDSLTSGYYGRGSAYHPYSEMLQTKLTAAFPHRDVTVLENGMPGDVVSFGAFNQRLGEELRRATAPFDWVIILGGTNDLGYGLLPEKIIESLEEAYNLALSADCKVLGLTVPETHSKNERLDARRNAINDSIMGFDEEKYYAFDLNAAIPYHSLSLERRKKYWDDGVHMLPDGYDRMGEHIAAALIKLMIQDVGATSRKSRRMLRYAQDELLFEEEAGDPSRIDEGYVIVRLKDLD